MLSQWVVRVGQVVAPDPRYESQATEEKQAEASDVDDDESFLLKMVAPDPHFEEASQHGKKTKKAQTKKPPPAAFFSPPSKPKGRDSVENATVVCVHCGGRTPINPSSANTKTATPSPDQSDKAEPLLSPLFSPTRRFTPSPSEELKQKLMTAIKATTEAMVAPKPDVIAGKIFRLASSSTALNSKMEIRLETELRKDPVRLLCARAVYMGTSCPNGFTPLMAAASSNQSGATKLILKIAAENKLLQQVQDAVDLQGRTTAHIAAEMGFQGVLDQLSLLDGVNAPRDAAGMTPLARASISTNKSAIRNRSEIRSKLLSPGDPSIYGEQASAIARTETVYGMTLSRSEIPGYRVRMEDSVGIHAWDRQVLVSVCDGHDDQGLVSAFVAEHIKTHLQRALRETQSKDAVEPYELACLSLDLDLKNLKMRGGSTAVMALITDDAIVVANVGDSRCLLVQKGEAFVKLAHDLGMVSLEEPKEGTQEVAKDEGEGVEESKEEPPEETLEESNSVIVQSLTVDHKPDNPEEKARIEKAGLSVIEHMYTQDGVKQVVHQIRLSEKKHMTVARAFGDFEYKKKDGLSPTQQAIIALPEVTVHERNHARDLYLILCCDGIFDVMSNDEVGCFVATTVDELVEKNQEVVLAEVADRLVDEALQKGSQDNLTAVIVALSPATSKMSSGMPAKALF